MGWFKEAAAPVPEPAVPLHPYYPLGVVIPGYVANTMSTTTILAVFSATCAAILLPTYLAIRRMRPSLPTCEIATALWFVLCGFIHLGLEGHFALNALSMGPGTDVLTQLWKEYALSDSRYLSGVDSFVISMEAVTAVCWGPLSYFCAYFIVVNNPYRHPLQLIISLGQLYGDVLYFATSTFDEVVLKQAYSRPESYYFYGYYVLLNAFWIVIPFGLVVSSARATARAFTSVNNQTQQNGKAVGKSRK